MPAQMSPERAEILGLQALTWLVGEPDALALFLKLSGVSGAELRDAAGSSGLNLAVLDFLLAHEEFLLAFGKQNETSPALLHQARRILAPEA
jgi:hypothetical protein